MKVLYFSFMLSIFCTFSADGQHGRKEILNTILDFYKANYKGGGDRNSFDIFFNSAESMLDLDGRQIPLKRTRVLYEFQDSDDNVSAKHWVKFRCIVKGCFDGLDQSDSNTVAYGMPFKTKKACYDFINLIGQLKKTL